MTLKVPDRHLTLGIVQASFDDNLAANLAKAKEGVRAAAAKGAQVILLPELFQGPYFCVSQEESWFSVAYPWKEHPCVLAMAELAASLGVVLPVSIFEKSGPHYYNSLVMIEADGSCLGVYRKSHIPDGPGYQEKYYFRPGDTGFRVWQTRYGALGAGICWDQWFPEAARAMTLMGAEVLLYPTAIGSEPHDCDLDTSIPWRRAMQGHAVSNIIPVAAANRIGQELGFPRLDSLAYNQSHGREINTSPASQTFYGLSFISNHRGDFVAELGRTEEGIATATFDLNYLTRHRAAWGFFRDRRTDLYQSLTQGDS